MTKKQNGEKTTTTVSAQPRLHQRANEIQSYGTVNHLLPLELEETVRLEMTAQLNRLLADTMTLRDLYKKCHWQVAGPTFYQLHLLFDKHYDEQVELVDALAERIQLLGGVSIAMAADVAETTRGGKRFRHIFPRSWRFLSLMRVSPDCKGKPPSIEKLLNEKGTAGAPCLHAGRRRHERSCR